MMTAEFDKTSNTGFNHLVNATAGRAKDLWSAAVFSALVIFGLVRAAVIYARFV